MLWVVSQNATWTQLSQNHTIQNVMQTWSARHWCSKYASKNTLNTIMQVKKWIVLFDMYITISDLIKLFSKPDNIYSAASTDAIGAILVLCTFKCKSSYKT